MSIRSRVEKLENPGGNIINVADELDRLKRNPPTEAEYLAKEEYIFANSDNQELIRLVNHARAARNHSH